MERVAPLHHDQDPQGRRLHRSSEFHSGSLPGTSIRRMWPSRTHCAARAIAWDATRRRKAPNTSAGLRFADPIYPLREWLARASASGAQKHWADTSTHRGCSPCGSARNDGTCPGRFQDMAIRGIGATSCKGGVERSPRQPGHLEYGRNIHPCKGCVSTACPVPLAVRCYSNHALDQVNDWMARSTNVGGRARSHHRRADLLVPMPSPLKLMIDRLVWWR